jgi:hypothetical protein
MYVCMCVLLHKFCFGWRFTPSSWNTLFLFHLAMDQAYKIVYNDISTTRHARIRTWTSPKKWVISDDAHASHYINHSGRPLTKPLFRTSHLTIQMVKVLVKSMIHKPMQTEAHKMGRIALRRTVVKMMVKLRILPVVMVKLLVKRTADGRQSLYKVEFPVFLFLYRSV